MLSKDKLQGRGASGSKFVGPTPPLPRPLLRYYPHGRSLGSESVMGAARIDASTRGRPAEEETPPALNSRVPVATAATVAARRRRRRRRRRSRRRRRRRRPSHPRRRGLGARGTSYSSRSASPRGARTPAAQHKRKRRKQPSLSTTWASPLPHRLNTTSAEHHHGRTNGGGGCKLASARRTVAPGFWTSQRTATHTATYTTAHTAPLTLNQSSYTAHSTHAQLFSAASHKQHPLNTQRH